MPTMTSMPITEKSEIVEALRKKIGERPVAQIAEEMGVGRQHLYDVLRGRRDPGPTILHYLGLEKVTTYRKVRR